MAVPFKRPRYSQHPPDDAVEEREDLGDHGDLQIMHRSQEIALVYVVLRREEVVVSVVMTPCTYFSYGNMVYMFLYLRP